MKAIMLIDCNRQNPVAWASGMECGIKDIESRVWPVPPKLMDNGPFDLLICASKSSITANAGRAVCVVEVYESGRMTVDDEKGVGCPIYPGAYAWKTRNLRWLPFKFQVKGRQKLFDIDDEAMSGVINALHTPTPEELFERSSHYYAKGFFARNWYKDQSMLVGEAAKTIHFKTYGRFK